MAKANKTFTLQGSINGASSTEGMSVTVFNSKGKALDSETLNGSSNFELTFKTKRHFNAHKQVKSASSPKISIAKPQTS